MYNINSSGTYLIVLLRGLNDLTYKGFRPSLAHVCLYVLALVMRLFFILLLLERIKSKLIIIGLIHTEMMKNTQTSQG